MASYDKDEVPMLSDVHQRSVDENDYSGFHPTFSRARSASISIPMSSMKSYANEASLVGYTGPLRSERRPEMIRMTGPIYTNRKADNIIRPKRSVTGSKIADVEVDQHDWTMDKYPSINEHLLRSGQLGVCNDPFCTTCPIYDNFKPAQQKHSTASAILDYKLHNALYGDAKSWAGGFVSSLSSYIPGVMNPHSKDIQRWNKFFVISCLVAIFVDPLFFFLLSVQQDKKCIVIDWALTKAVVVLRSMTDFIYFLNIILQFKLAYIAPESLVVGAGELVDHPKKIAMNYIRGYFSVDLFILLPLPQIIILLVLPNNLGSSGANYAKNLLRAAVLVQYIPRLYRFLPLVVGVSPNGFIFETAWANFFINLLTFVLAGHVVGSFWYLFGLQRVNQCLRNACHNSNIRPVCTSYIDCGRGNNVENFVSDPTWKSWKSNENASACFTMDGFRYGIYIQAVNLTAEHSVITRYVYSLFWGFQQISTLAGNQTPSYFVWEVLFTMAIVGLGLLLFAFLIGNIQNFLLALGRRRLEMSLRRRDVGQWMSHRRLPQNLRRFGLLP
ncbi:probable cyclic nucleotide-gated ion channel 20, chloroplastic isoform X2 [Mercurialis annua]|uniref:probable cyclic nucleotide-gated ion channel 20, chloroplastic isoform X2 n=1 Tax=Mercurialis annua TaxID=3986 RepID=UPI0024AE5765|nr:probable cyclic nucleotide-gated ion channel 20, chloroplastic isoform X2 [Mercurialis annua]